MRGPELPRLQAGFRWEDAPWGTVLRADVLDGLRHGWTTCQLALRGTPEIEANGWSQVALAAQTNVAQLVRLRQVHGSHVYNATGAVTGAASSGAAAPEADAAVCCDPSLALT